MAATLGIRVRDLAVAGVASGAAATLLLTVASEIPGESLESVGDIRSPAFFPIVNASFLLACGLVLAISALTAKRAPASPGDALFHGYTLLATISILGIYLFAVAHLGFLVSSVVLVAVLAPILGYRNVWIVVPAAVIFPAVIYFVFQRTLRILLPEGLLF